MHEFHVTEYVVKQSRKVKKQYGLLPDMMAKKGGRKLAEDVEQRVKEFYQSQENSRICPGMKEFVVVREQGVKTHVQKQLLLVNMKELYASYKMKSPDDKIGFSKFSELKPKWCLPVTAPGMQRVCVCVPRASQLSFGWYLFQAISNAKTCWSGMCAQ